MLDATVWLGSQHVRTGAERRRGETGRVGQTGAAYDIAHETGLAQLQHQFRVRSVEVDREDVLSARRDRVDGRGLGDIRSVSRS